MYGRKEWVKTKSQSMDIAMESLAITMLKKYKDIVLKGLIRRLFPLYF